MGSGQGRLWERSGEPGAARGLAGENKKTPRQQEDCKIPETVVYSKKHEHASNKERK